VRRLALAFAAVIVASAVMPGMTVGHQTMRWGWAKPLENVFEYPSCVGRATFWHQELGDSGINRLRAKVELRGQYDTTGLPLVTYGDTGWLYSKPFPDDARSLYVTWWTRLNYPYGHIYSAQAILIGERPSFWQLDRKMRVTLGEYACTGDPGGL
jgi:hypothetical protein